MQKAGLLLSVCARAWRSVRKASSGMARQHPLANKVALVTASTDGIGFAIARRLAQDGAHVIVSSRKQQNVDRAVATLQGEGLSVTGTVCHVGKAEDRERLVATVSSIHSGLSSLFSSLSLSFLFSPIKRFPLASSFFLQMWMDKEREESIKEMLRIRRIGEPEECAGIVSFLCSEDASYISGETVVVAGGAPSRL
ncbi:PREDICTED: dehydrogenase/reductase SDR family member 4-like isoform X2 [Chrysochloris asiatica]|uniref:Dehydrogenase/reductase SDR family member 4-like isoform X2 n=1 Tax=Chrysochloris asiatica TaxID=185453 RepID=A0A9B0T9A5_CHRAS|nr:PREDICTED: dehydrogenase/reductase SDR family member 4-like isoform X2 [Chrysochloris asiatica]